MFSEPRKQNTRGRERGASNLSRGTMRNTATMTAGTAGGGAPQPRQTDILNRHPPRDGSQLHGGVAPLTIHSDGTCANADGPSPCLPACLMKGKWAPQHRGKRKEAFCRIKITPSEGVAAILKEGSGIFHWLVLNCQPAS